jgi:hypothetical protein
VKAPSHKKLKFFQEEPGASNFKGKEVFYMPGFDGRGPAGTGSMTGRGQGFCNPSRTADGPTPILRRGYRSYGYGQGFGRGFGQGRCFRAGFGSGFGQGRGYGRGLGRCGVYPPTGREYGPAYYAPYENPYAIKPEDEVNILKGEADAVKKELDAINKRIKEIEAVSSEK